MSKSQLHVAKIAVTVLQATSECWRARLRVRFILLSTPLSMCPGGSTGWDHVRFRAVGESSRGCNVGALQPVAECGVAFKGAEDRFGSIVSSRQFSHANGIALRNADAVQIRAEDYTRFLQ